jgi:aryl-alcohol dehydrogenase-like predicted oxidoreductase
MLHRASHITQWNGWVWERLLELKKSCVIGQLGVSVQTPDELSEVLKNDKIEFIQMPFNLLDWRWEKLILDILSVKKKRNLQIHVRSVLLQGLLTSLDDANWVRAHVADGPALRRWLANQVKINKKSNIIDLCISYVNSHQWIDGIVIGLESMGQLIENLKYFNEPIIQHTQMKEITRSRPRLESKTLNPALWG